MQNGWVFTMILQWFYSNWCLQTFTPLKELTMHGYLYIYIHVIVVVCLFLVEKITCKAWSKGVTMVLYLKCLSCCWNNWPSNTGWPSMVSRSIPFFCYLVLIGYWFVVFWKLALAFSMDFESAFKHYSRTRHQTNSMHLSQRNRTRLYVISCIEIWVHVLRYDSIPVYSFDFAILL